MILPTALVGTHNICSTYHFTGQGAAVAPKKTVKALVSMSSTSAAGFDGLPREDVSAKITPNLLKNLSSPDWKV